VPHPEPDGRGHVDARRPRLAGQALCIAPQDLVPTGVNEQRGQAAQVAVARREQGVPDVSAAGVVARHVQRVLRCQRHVAPGVKRCARALQIGHRREAHGRRRERVARVAKRQEAGQVRFP
jgi:hypothetical protein